MRTQIVILAAGKGTRMGSPIPKVLTMLKDKPLILHLLEGLEPLIRVHPPVVVVGYRQAEVRAVLGSHYRYAVQTQQLGTAHALAAARPALVAEHIIVLYGDMPFVRAESIKRLFRVHEETKSLFSMFTATAPHFREPYQSLMTYGRIIRRPDGALERVTEYRDAGEAEREILEVNPGIYVFKSSWLWDHLEGIGAHNAQGEYYLTDMVSVAAALGVPIATLPLDPAEAIGVNTPEQLLQAELVLTAGGGGARA